MENVKQHGTLEVIAGCMSSGKSEELIRRLRRATIAKQKVLVFKPALDNRTDEKQIASRNGDTYDAVPINNVLEISHLLSDDVKVIAFDEAQFFSADLLPVIRSLIASGRRVIAAGLDVDFRGIAFGIMGQLLAEADRVTKLDAVCMRCGGRAIRSQRFINGKPAPFDSSLIAVGGDEMYEARCRSCLQIVESREP